MGDNCNVLIDSLCHTCQKAMQFIPNGQNDWTVVCSEKKTVLPQMKCKKYVPESG